MKTFVSILRQDLAVVRWQLLLWLVALAMAFAANQFATAEFLESQKFLLILNHFGIFVLGLMIAGRVLFNHPARDDRSAWRVRPLPGRLVALAKWAGLSALLVVPLAALWSHQLLNTAGPAARDLGTIFGRNLRALAAALLAFLYVGSLCRTSSHLLAVIFVCFFALPLATSQLLAQEIGFGWLFLSPTGMILAWSVYFGGFGALLLRQYDRPQTLRHVLGGCGVLAVILGVAAVFPRSPEPRPVATVRADVYDKN